MRRKFLSVGAVICLGSWGGAWLAAQSLSESESTNAAIGSPSVTAAAPSEGSGTTVGMSAETAPASAKTGSGDDSAGMMTESSFVIDGVPYAQVLYVEGNVWIRQPGNMAFHQLTEEEPIAADSVIYTGFNGTLDFATGPGMAVRMVPGTVLRVSLLPQPASASPTATPTAATPEASQVAVKRGTIFSVLGREDGAPIDFEVRTQQGVASARGTMFSTTVTDGQAQVDMLHGTVNFETPDHQTSQITAGQSQQISGKAGGAFQFGQRQGLNPANSETFFNHAGGLLEHASGYGVVRRGLGGDVSRTLQERGFKLPAAMQERFQRAGSTRYTHRPGFNRAILHRRAAGGATGTVYHPVTPGYHPTTTSSAASKNRADQEREREEAQRRRESDWLNGRGDR